MNIKQLSITVNKNNVQFLEELAKRQNKSRSEIIDSVLTEFRNFQLKKEVAAGFKNQSQTDLNEAMLGFGDYLSIIENNA